MIFNLYAQYYNLFYRDKDYKSEVNYVVSLIRKYKPAAKSVLDLGCGTGRHDLLLVDKGYFVTGVDQSAEMLAVANSNLPTPNLRSALTFMHGDIRNIRLNKTFDVVISLFHVMSYQTANEDLNAAFETAKIHLKKGGLFIFDCWYGPGVLSERPSTRIKRLKDEAMEITRLAEPVMHENENIVDVNYHIYKKNKSSGKIEECEETHFMRYLFKPEIEMILKNKNLKLVVCEEWMTGKEPGLDTWSACFVVQR